MIRLLTAAALVMAACSAKAAPITGLWLTQDHDGVIAVTPCDGGLCARIDGLFLDHPTDPTPRDYRGLSQCHLPLVTDAKPVKPNLWKGHILDPRNGSMYGVELHLTPKGDLALRGYLGIPLLGHTETWTRYTGRVPADCRIAEPPPAGPINPRR